MLWKRAVSCYTALPVIWQGQKQSEEENTDDNHLKNEPLDVQQSCVAATLRCARAPGRILYSLGGNIHLKSTPAI